MFCTSFFIDLTPTLSKKEEGLEAFSEAID
jgi:hypothetical protein